MSEKVEAQAAPAGDAVKWTLAVALLTGAIVGNEYLSEQLAFFYRVAAIIVLCGLGLFVASLTQQGRSFIALLADARIEMKKVVWPTQQETMQTTGVVMLVVFFVSILLWFLDLLLGFAVSELIG